MSLPAQPPTALLCKTLAIPSLVAVLFAGPASGEPSAAGGGNQPAESRAPWSRITTEHFTIYSGGGRRAGLQLAEVMETLHSVLEGLVGADAQSPLPTFVYLFPDDDALQPFKPAMANGRIGSGRAVAGGFFAQRELANYVAINLKTSRDARETVQHEYLHYFAQHNLPRLPLWFSEGLAEYYSTFYVRDGIGYVGAPVQRHLRRLSQDGDYHATRQEIEELVEAHSSKELYDDSHRASLLYAKSWALVHHLLSDNLLAEMSMDFMRSLARGNPPEQAFRESFEESPGAFSFSLQEYLARASFPTFRATVSRNSTPRIDSLQTAHQDAVLGDLALATNHHTLARRLFLDARRRSGQLDSPAASVEVAGLANVGLSRVAMAGQDFDQALLLASNAGYLIPGSPLPFLLEGRILSQQARLLEGSDSSTASRTKLLDQARRALRLSLDRDGDFPAALVSLGETWLGDPRTSVSPDSFAEEGLRSLSRALDLLPKRRGIAIELALLQTQMGHFPKAVQILHRERVRFDLGEYWDAAWEQIASFEIRLLRNNLNRIGKPPLDISSLYELNKRVKDFQELVLTQEKLDRYYNEAQELARLVKIESLWTALDSAVQLADDGNPTLARVEIEDILRELEWNRQLEGERITRLEVEARRLLLALPSLQ